MGNLWLDIYTRPTDVKIFRVYDIKHVMTIEDTNIQVAIMDSNESIIKRISGGWLMDVPQKGHSLDKLSYQKIPRKIVIRDDHQHEVYHDDSAIIDICNKMFFGFMRLDISHYPLTKSKID